MIIKVLPQIKINFTFNMVIDLSQQQELLNLYPFNEWQKKNVYGQIYPWYTHPCLEWLEKNLTYNLSILEFGGGFSTLWWRTVGYTTTVESDIRTCNILGIRPKTAIDFLQDNEEEYDIVIVDGDCDPRQDYIMEAFRVSSKYLIVDNWQQPSINCVYPDDIVDYLMNNTKQQLIFSQPGHNDWKTAVFIKN